MRVDVFLIAEKTFYAVAPDFAQLLAFVVIAQCARRVDVFGHPCAGIPYHRFDVVAESLAAQFETVAPTDREFPAVGFERSVVAFGCVGAVNGGQAHADGVHVGGIATVPVESDRQPVAEQIHVEAYVVGGRRLPRQRERNGSGSRRIGAQCVADDDRRGFDGHVVDVFVGVDVAIAHRTGRETYLEIVEPVARPLHEFLFRQAPADRSRGEEAPFRVFGEFRRAVVAATEFSQIFALIAVVGTEEGAHVTPVVSRNDGIAGKTVHQTETRFRGYGQPFALDGRSAVFLRFEVPAGEQLERMVVAEFRRVFSVNVARQVVRVLTQIFQRTALTFVNRDRSVGASVTGIHVGHTLAFVAGEKVGEIARYFQYVLHHVDLDAQFVFHGEFVVLLVARSFGEACVTVQYGGISPPPVGVGDGVDRLSSVFDHALRKLETVIEHRLVVVHHREIHVVIQPQPGTDADVAFGADVVLFVTFVAHAVNAVLIVETARYIIVRILIAARYADIVLVRVVEILVESVHPVGVGEVFVLILVVDAHAFERRIGAAACQFLVPAIGIGGDVVDVGWQRILSVVIAVPRVYIAGRPFVAVGYQLWLDRARVKRKTAVVSDFRFALFGRFGRYQNHSECAACSVDRSRRGIFEHRDAGDVLRVDRFQVAFHAVDEHQCPATRTDRTGTADVDRRCTRGFAVAHRDVEVGNGALQRPRDARIRTFGENLAVDLIDGADQIATLHCTVADYYYFVEHLFVLFQNDVDAGLRAYAPFG